MIRSVRGMRDVLPEESRHWRHAEDAMRAVLLGHGYEEIHLPLLEFTDLFSRGVGEATDIVEKEMYTLADRDGASIALRPEGTASCVRALLQNGLLYNQTQRVFYGGPMFRYERPQKGRYRQFYQLGAEAFGFAGPDVDAELISMGWQLWRALAIEQHARLEINSLGSSASRAAYRLALVTYLEPYARDLDEDSRRRLDTNPLRILDSKHEQTRKVLERAPRLVEFADDESKAHFEVLCALLDERGVEYRINPNLVRGLDYYTHTVFEWITDDLGAQGTICAGGRYDGLVELLGGRPTPAAGFALGVERVLLLREGVLGTEDFSAGADVYCCVLGRQHQALAMRLTGRLREDCPGVRIRTHAGGGKAGNQLRRADACGARVALLVGEDEAASDTVTVKYLREDKPQTTLPSGDLGRLLEAYFS